MIAHLGIAGLKPLVSRLSETKVRTNCKQCSKPTCYSFALKLAVSQKRIADCPPLADRNTPRKIIVKRIGSNLTTRVRAAANQRRIALDLLPEEILGAIRRNELLSQCMEITSEWETRSGPRGEKAVHE